MRRAAGLSASIAAVATIAGIAVPAASAAPANIQAGVAPNQNLFGAASFTHEAGTVATVTHVAGGSHNVTASPDGPDGKPLFRSATIPSGSAPVAGTQYVPQGSYPFSCTIHFGMNSTLDVTSGAPLARPTVAVKLTSTKLAKVVKKKKVAIKVTLTGGEAATIAVKLGKRTLGTGTTSTSGGLSVKLSGKGAKALEGKKKAKLTLDASVDFGSPAKASGTLK